MNPDVMAGQIRNILSFVGGIAVGRGLLTSDMLQAIIGLVGPAITAYWSWKSKKATA